MAQLAGFLQEEAGGQLQWDERLTRLLRALARRHPHIGFTPSLVHIVAAMLIFVPEEPKCFACISHIFVHVLQKDFFARPPFSLDGWTLELSSIPLSPLHCRVYHRE